MDNPQSYTIHYVRLHDGLGVLRIERFKRTVTRLEDVRHYPDAKIVKTVANFADGKRKRIQLCI